MPTEKGLALYSVVKNMRIANVELTGDWEAALAKIERGEMRAETFREAIEIYTKLNYLGTARFGQALCAQRVGLPLSQM